MNQKNESNSERENMGTLERKKLTLLMEMLESYIIFEEAYLVVPCELITQLVLPGESSICPGSPWMFMRRFLLLRSFFCFLF